MQLLRRTLLLLLLTFSDFAWAQTPTDAPTSLDECLNYALRNQPTFKQSALDQEINERAIRASLSAWMPQIRAEYNLQHFLRLPVNFFPVDPSNPDGPRRPVTLGLKNTSNLLFQADQVLYNNDLLLASKAARYSRQQYRQNVDSSRINVVVNVSKAFYDLLLTGEQLAVLDEAIARLQQQFKDTYQLYQGGLTDKVDYKRASIALNNARAQRKTAQEALKYKSAYLKQVMGYPSEKELTVAFDTLRMRQEVAFDTLQVLNYENRIEYQILKNRTLLQTLDVKYYRWGFLPTVTASINYNFLYQNNNFNNLYDQNFPNSVAGIRVSLPLFQGTRRLQYLQHSKLQLQRLELTLANTRNAIHTQYQQALALYKSNYYEWKTEGENLELARDVYNTLRLQYEEGIKTYLDVITAESDLKTSQLNYLTALYNVLSSKLDLQRALGTIAFNP